MPIPYAAAVTLPEAVRALGWRGFVRNLLRGAWLASTGHPPPHRYLSTYCWHQLHADCRLTCKTCRAPCVCACHRKAAG